MPEPRTFTEQELLEIVERQNLVSALEYAIMMGKQRGDPPAFVNPLINLLYNIQNPPQPQPQKQAEPVKDGEDET